MNFGKNWGRGAVMGIGKATYHESTEHDVQSLFLKEQQKLLSILHHYRHDMSNDLQLIFGYIKLKKYEELERLVKKLTADIMGELPLLNLDDPGLSMDLLLFKQNNKGIGLNLNIEQENIWVDIEPARTICRRAVLSILYTIANAVILQDGLAHVINVHIKVEDGMLQLGVYYSGRFNNDNFAETMEEELKRLISDSSVSWACYSDESEASVEIVIPLETY